MTARAVVRNPVKPGDGDPRHGKPSTYTNHACRCPLCTDGMLAYQRNGRVQYGYLTPARVTRYDDSTNHP